MMCGIRIFRGSRGGASMEFIDDVGIEGSGNEMQVWPPNARGHRTARPACWSACRLVEQFRHWLVNQEGDYAVDRVLRKIERQQRRYDHGDDRLARGAHVEWGDDDVGGDAHGKADDRAYDHADDRSLADIIESIDELKYYKRAIFRPVGFEEARAEVEASSLLKTWQEKGVRLVDYSNVTKKD